MLPQNLHVCIYTSFIHNQPKLEITQRFCTGEWINWHMHSMECHLTIKNNESIHIKTWTNLKCILLSERSQGKKATSNSICIMIWNYRDGKQVGGHQALRGKRRGWLHRNSTRNWGANGTEWKCGERYTTPCVWQHLQNCTSLSKFCLP